MPDLFTYCEVELKDFIAEALITKDTLLKRVISTATESLVTYIPASIHNEAMLSGAWTSIAQ